MALHTYRLGEARRRGEGLRIGTIRFLPRGVRKTDYAEKDYFDSWLPQLAPSHELVHWLKSDEIDEKRWSTFARRYRKEMDTPDNRHLIELLAAFAHRSDISIGCHCEDENHCHREPRGDRTSLPDENRHESSDAEDETDDRSSGDIDESSATDLGPEAPQPPAIATPIDHDCRPSPGDPQTGTAAYIHQRPPERPLSGCRTLARSSAARPR